MAARPDSPSGIAARIERLLSRACLLTLGYWLALVLTIWILASHLLYSLAVVTQTRWLLDVLTPITLPAVRRVAAGAAGITISLSTIAAPAIAQDTHLAPVVATADIQLEPVGQAVPTPRLQPVATVAATGSYSAPLTWEVQPGDHLWSIAERHLTIVLDRTPEPGELDSYWRLLVDTALRQLASGDPDLIYPGEQITLPPTMDAGIQP